MAALEKEHPAVEQQIETPEGKEEVTKELGVAGAQLQQVQQTPTAVIDDATGQPVLTPTQVQPTNVVLPLTQEEIKHGLHHKIFDSIRWLAAWCLRLAKKAVLLGLRVVYPKR